MTYDPPEDAPRKHHDMGGVSRLLCEKIDTSSHALSEFDRQVDAIRGVLGFKGVLRVDELRRAIEAIPPAEYDALSYYQRWVRAIASVLVEKDVIGEAELADALAAA